MANTIGLSFVGKKSRMTDKAYAVFHDEGGEWEWRVLKTWQNDDSKLYARWFCYVSSPYTFGSADMGDTYVADVLSYGRLVSVDGREPTEAERAEVRELRGAIFDRVLGLKG